jgi:argininosuccinate lyase
MKVKKLWGARFEALPSQEIIDFLSGRDVKGTPPCDERLIPYDLWGSRAHVLMLYRQNILSRQEAKKILKGLRDIEKLHGGGKLRLDPSREDVHSNIESRLIDRTGMQSGGKIHTGRSRNDQVAVDMRLYLREEVLDYAERVLALIATLAEKAERHRTTLMPGYTHHQQATVTTFGHLLLSFAEALWRDAERFLHWMALFNRNPLGAAAGYGTSFHLDRMFTSRLLGFEGPTENVTDPITQRWEAEAELAYAVTVTLNHLSSIAQTFILLSTREFDMIRLDDRHCTGSSIMPQKRNPDCLEAVKAKAALAQGLLAGLLSTGRALFMGYNRETQWTKYGIMDLVDETKPALSVMREIIQLLQVNETQMLAKTRQAFVGATSLMEWMVETCGLPLRQAKTLVEKAVKGSEAEREGRVTYRNLERALREMKIKIPLTPRDVDRRQAAQSILEQPLVFGMPSRRGTQGNLVSLRARIKQATGRLLQARKDIEKAKTLTVKTERQLTR